MAQLLRNFDLTVLSSQVPAVLPKKDTVKAVKRLLSGGYHVQTIGTAPSKVELTLIGTRANMLLINEFEAIGEEVKLIYGDYYYVGVIENQPNWQFLSVDTYKTTLTILSSSEGYV